MTLSIDTNVIAALWNRDDALNSATLAAFERLYASHAFVVSAPVFAELMAGPLRTEAALEAFFLETGITVEWQLDEPVWRMAGKAFTAYADRRRKEGKGMPRRLLTDFLVGAHAQLRGHAVLTFDQRLYRAAFPQLELVSA